MSGQTTIDTATSDFNTTLGVYTGIAVNALTEIDSNDDWQSEFTSQVTFAATIGTTYRFRVDGVEADTGTINLHLNDVQPPPNDNFANAILLAGTMPRGPATPTSERRSRRASRRRSRPHPAEPRSGTRGRRPTQVW